MAWAGLKADKPQVHGIDDFIAYFESTWLGGQFAPAKWNVYSEEGLKGGTAKVKKIAGKNHLNSFETVLFKKEHASTEVEIRQLIRIKAIVDNFDNYTIIDYLTALSYWVGK